MESLEARFDAVQEQLLQIYETESSSLELAITYWSLIRKECALYYHARLQGKTRLGLYPVPATRVSEAKAKDAIKMSLFLESLQKSPFANLKWSLVDTSLENFNAPPANTFKKRGMHVTVIYDSNANNSMVYTSWQDVFYVDEQDTWHKAHSEVDYDGIFYRDAQGNKVYYVHFQDDAALYSTLGQWEVHVENRVLSPPVTSSVPGGPAHRRRPQAGDNATGYAPGLPARPTDSHPDDSRGRRSRPQSPSRPQSRSRSRSRSRTPTQRPRAGRRDSHLFEGPGRPPGERGRGSPSQRTQSRTPSPPTPGEVGSRSTTSARKASSRLAKLIEDAYDPPVLLVQGAQNTLKCFRRRATLSHPHRFLCMSTSWTWVSKTSTLKSGHRMLIAFANSDQRTSFLSHVRLPKGVTCVKGSLDGL